VDPASVLYQVLGDFGDLSAAFGFDVLACGCGGRLRLIALIEPGIVCARILRHLGVSAEVAAHGRRARRRWRTTRTISPRLASQRSIPRHLARRTPPVVRSGWRCGQPPSDPHGRRGRVAAMTLD
jgi:hypothetical protein